MPLVISIIAGDAFMAKKKSEKHVKLNINFIPVEGDVIEIIGKALEPNINSILARHGASLKIGLFEIIRNHAKG
ncbi:hypothetical protein [Paenibacillus terrae]|uniref:Uncharacterized protein n=1 Tax=Paenibacillus terrae TaxID=159743 RepID=A0A0D7WXD0_9BACL|nr:hypothetical protein [Paenibacillus terrae]KJD43378.1 hypothetical protein QD47_23015 [Paenibacillus terrae]